jgi:hypothetical protein
MNLKSGLFSFPVLIIAIAVVLVFGFMFLGDSNDGESDSENGDEQNQQDIDNGSDDDIQDDTEGTFESNKGVVLTLTSPDSQGDLSCPLNISGSITGSWYFEADFPVRLVDAAGTELYTVIAQAQEDWMTSEDVDFNALVNCDDNELDGASLVFVKDNVSDLGALDDEVVVELSEL